ncbi:hypothetical protein D5S17_24540 [Pseudonocardiaceae bacterium YIM PH 21723]|nr:hypothetical protein D5S17_24540 [Pseudonocardiaceae bacterium YIM PH 21723]
MDDFDFSDFAERFAGDDEFERYQKLWEDVLRQLRRNQERIADRLGAVREKIADVDRRVRVIGAVGVRVTVVLSALLLLTGLSGIVALELKAWDLPRTSIRVLEGLALLILIVGGIGHVVAQRDSRLNRRVLLEWDTRRTALNQQRDTIIGEELATAINEVLRAQGIEPLTSRAPRLVELDNAQITPVETVRRVLDFIEQHQASAIGLAGVRGSGKSTALRAVATRPHLRDFAVLIPAPTIHEPGELIHILLQELASRLSLPQGIPSLGPIQSTRWMPRLVLRYPRAAQTRLSPVARKARELLDWLNWEVESGTVAKLVGKVPRFAEASTERNTKRRSRPVSQADLVLRLRELLRLSADTYADRRVIVCIDELDKLDRPEHLPSVINEIKELFHIPGVHFLISVSTDALDAFERRGMPYRGTFDSAFDTVIFTDRLTQAESQLVISARAAGFGERMASFCHVWSGGLVRDLLRIARAAVECQRGSDEVLSVPVLLTRVITAELVAAVRSALYACPAESPDLKSLCALYLALTSSPGVEQVVTLPLEDTENQILRDKAILGLRLIAVAERPEADSLSLVIDTFATAVDRLSWPRPLRELALADALRVSESPSAGGTDA